MQELRSKSQDRSGDQRAMSEVFGQTDVIRHNLNKKCHGKRHGIFYLKL